MIFDSLIGFLPLRKSEHITGTYVTERMSEPMSAKVTVSAIGRNSLPSIPWSVMMGR